MGQEVADASEEVVANGAEEEGGLERTVRNELGGEETREPEGDVDGEQCDVAEFAEIEFEVQLRNHVLNRVEGGEENHEANREVEGLDLCLASEFLLLEVLAQL